MWLIYPFFIHLIKWAYGGLILGTSTGHRRLKYQSIFPSDEKKIVFVYPLSKSKYKTNFGVFLLPCGWF
jgi:hypothetical protein